MQPLKILWLSHLIPFPPKGGVLQRTHYLLRGVSKVHTVDLLTFTQPALLRPVYSSKEESDRATGGFLSSACRRFKVFDIPSDVLAYGKQRLAFKCLGFSAYTMEWLRSDEFRRTLREWVREEHYDLVLFDTISLCIYAPDIPAGVATILDHHNVESAMMARRASNERSMMKRAYFHLEAGKIRRAERYWCPRMTANILCSDDDARLLQSLSPASKVRTIPNGVDVEYFSPGKQETAPRLIFVGRMNWYPNLQAVRFIVVSLWPLLKARWPTLILDLVGANPAPDILAAAESDPQIRVHGFVDDFRPLMREAAAVICPITDGGGTKLKILDAMAMGKVIIANPIACEGIQVVDGVHVLMATAPAEYVERLEYVFTRPDAASVLEANARKLAVDAYSFSSIGQSLADLMASCAGR